MSGEKKVPLLTEINDYLQSLVIGHWGSQSILWDTQNLETFAIG